MRSMPEEELRAAGGPLLEELTTIVSAAAAAILAVRAGPLDARSKPDLSPVTAADHAAEAVILEGLARLLPDVPVVSEEAAGRAPPARLPDTFILVDPLDGTREYVAGRDEFTVNVAIVAAGRPVLGIVAAPALAMLWRAAAGSVAERLHLVPGAPASAARERIAIRCRALPRTGGVVAVSRSHLDARTQAFLSGLPQSERIVSGSALKFCRVAEGAADVYPRLAPTCEWDVAAGHAVVAAAGGTVVTPAGAPLPYGRIAEQFRIPAFIAWGDPAAARDRGPGTQDQ
jgi:3'(2'), 5'-bisphosphate nucleotidase